MADGPAVDGTTVKYKGFGKYGVPIDPYGGITLTPDGATMTPIMNTGFVSYTPIITFNDLPLGSFMYEDIRCSYRKQGKLVDYVCTWRPKQNFMFGEDWTTLGGELKFSLPVYAEDLYFWPFRPMSSTIRAIQSGVKDYGGLWADTLGAKWDMLNPEVEMMYIFQNDGLIMTSDSPFIFGSPHSLYFHIQYISKE